LRATKLDKRKSN